MYKEQRQELLATMKSDWWSEEYGFFGDFYMAGDDSYEGYRSGRKQTLEERTAAEVEGVLRLLPVPPKGKILDCPCGYGRHSNALAEKGFRVTGVDINEQHLAKARKKQQVPNVTYLNQDVRHLQFKDEFDSVINMFYSFGFFEEDSDNQRMLANIYKSLKVKGTFLMHTDVNVPHIEAGRYLEREVRTLRDGKQLSIVDRYDRMKRRINGSWSIRDEKGQEAIKQYSMRVYTKEEFMDLCHGVGFASCQAFADWNGTPYSTQAQDMIIVARKG